MILKRRGWLHLLFLDFAELVKSPNFDRGVRRTGDQSIAGLWNVNQRVDPVGVTIEISDQLHLLLFVSHVPKLNQTVSTATEQVALVLRLLVHDQGVDTASVRNLVGVPD